MRKTCFQFLNQIGFECAMLPDLTQTSFSDLALRAQLLAMLNRAKAMACREVQLDSLSLAEPFTSVAAYTTGKVSVSAGDTTVTGSGTTFTKDMVGEKIQIGGDLTSYQIITYTSPTSIQIDKAYVGTSQTLASFTIFQDVYTLSPRLTKIVDIARPGRDDVVKQVTLGWIDTRYPDPFMGAGDPDVFAKYATLMTREPVSGIFTADTGTTTTAVVVRSADYANMIHPTIQNYYQDWTLYNATRLATATITGWDVASKTLTLAGPITGQVATDTYFLVKAEIQVKMRPTPMAAYPFIANGYKAGTQFFNDYDFEVEIEPDYEDVLVYQACAEYYTSKDKARSDSYQARANQLYVKIKEDNDDMGVAVGVLGGGIAPESSGWALSKGVTLFTYRYQG